MIVLGVVGVTVAWGAETGSFCWESKNQAPTLMPITMIIVARSFIYVPY